jgi:hypothetical protein
MKNHLSQLSRLNRIIKYFDNVFVSLPEFGISFLERLKATTQSFVDKKMFSNLKYGNQKV